MGPGGDTHRPQGSPKQEVGDTKSVFSLSLARPSCKEGSPPPRCLMQAAPVCTGWAPRVGAPRTTWGTGPSDSPRSPQLRPGSFEKAESLYGFNDSPWKPPHGG